MSTCQGVSITRMPSPPRQRLLDAPAPTLCLDFANTRFWRGLAVPTETLPDFAALLQWLNTAGALDAESAAALRALVPAAAQALFDAALHTRELLYRLFSGAGVEIPALAALLATTPARAQWVYDSPQHAGWRVPMRSASVGEVLAPVLWSAADLMLAASRTRLRCCDNPQCRWLFIDDSRTGTRRWCSMSACGNRAKARRHAQRQRAA